MQPRRGGGDGAGFLGEHGLVVVPVFRMALRTPFNIGRQRHDAVASQRLLQVGTGLVEPKGDLAVLALAPDLRQEFVGHGDHIARFSFLAGFAKARQLSGPSRLCSVSSTRAPRDPARRCSGLGDRMPVRRAGTTRVSLKTMTSPGRSRPEGRGPLGRLYSRTRREKPRSVAGLRELRDGVFRQMEIERQLA